MGTSCLLTARVTGYRRVPEPPARMMPFMAMQDSIGAEKMATQESQSDKEEARNRLLRIISGPFEVQRGRPLPLGAALERGGVNFAVVARHATTLTLVLFVPGDNEPVLELPLDPVFNRTGDVWHVHVGGLDPGVEYGFRAGRHPNLVPQVHRFDPRKVLIDPYGRAVAGLETWGTGRGVSRAARLERMRSFLVGGEFDWGREHPLNIH